MNSIDPDFGEDERREPDARPDGPRLRRSAVYPHPVVDGRERREGASRAILNSFRGMFASRDGSQEVRLEARLAMPAAITRANVIAVISPKGGVGKTTVTFLIGNLLASRLKVRAIAIDANPDFGTLATLAPEATASDHSLADLLMAMPRLSSGAEVWPYVSRLPTGLHVVAAPRRAEVMERITPQLYGDLLAFLGQYYEIVLLDLGTGITDPLSSFAVQRADQVVVVTTPEWNHGHERLERAPSSRSHSPDRDPGPGRREPDRGLASGRPSLCRPPACPPGDHPVRRSSRPTCWTG